MIILSDRDECHLYLPIRTINLFILFLARTISVSEVQQLGCWVATQRSRVRTGSNICMVCLYFSCEFLVYFVVDYVFVHDTRGTAFP